MQQWCPFATRWDGPAGRSSVVESPGFAFCVVPPQIQQAPGRVWQSKRAVCPLPLHNKVRQQTLEQNLGEDGVTEPPPPKRFPMVLAKFLGPHCPAGPCCQPFEKGQVCITDHQPNRFPLHRDIALPINNPRDIREFSALQSPYPVSRAVIPLPPIRGVWATQAKALSPAKDSAMCSSWEGSKQVTGYCRPVQFDQSPVLFYGPMFVSHSTSIIEGAR